MSFDNQEIYSEMESNYSNSKKSGTEKIVAKLASGVLFIGIGFAIGNFYKASNTVPIISNGNNGIISTVSSATPATILNKGDALSIKDIATLNQDSIVEIAISATAKSAFFGTYTTTGSGSGIIISTNGYILTNNHVISSANDVKVKLHNGTEYTAKVIGSDAKTDVAVLKIDAKNLKPVTIGDSSKLSVGDTAVVIGNPLGSLGGTVTDGIISALEREITIDKKKMNLIQTNAAINPGNSGGGLFNANGELVGIVVAKSSGLEIEGLGFAIPVNDVTSIINDILQLGYVSNRPYLGVGLSDSKQVSSSYPEGNSIFDFFYGNGGSFTTTSYGAYVSSVEEGSAADKAGIKVDDQIISIDDEMCSSSADVSAAIGTHKVGDEVTIVIVRNNKMQKVTAKLQEYKGTADKEEVKES